MICELTDSQMEAQLRLRIQQLHQAAPESIGDLFCFEFVRCCQERGEYVFRCKTYPWMRNVAGSLHGGMAAALVDQAMGYVAYSIKPGDGFTPTVQIQLSYHRPLFPGDDVLVVIRTMSQSKNLMHFTAEVYRDCEPEKLCVSGTSVYYYKAVEKR